MSAYDELASDERSMDARILRALESGPTYIGLLALVVGAKSTRSRDFRRALGRQLHAGRIEYEDGVERGVVTVRLVK